MPQDPHLYGQPPPKKQKKELALSSSLSFASQLSSIIASPSSTSTIPARPRPSKSKVDDLANVKTKRKHAGADRSASSSSSKLTLKSPTTTEDEKALFERARQKMEYKSRLYAAMQRGDVLGDEPNTLVDFDRKWAESRSKDQPLESLSDSDSDEENDENNNDTTLVEYTDEYGRTRTGTLAQKLRHERQLARHHASTSELERMSARPKAPEQIIRGDTVQIEAFTTTEEMEDLARRRDKSPTPPEALHYQADKEMRTKGVGFYKFSADEETRTKEMKALEEERKRTEEARKEREVKAEKRKKELEERRRQIEERRAKKMADSFLGGLEKEFLEESRKRPRSSEGEMESSGDKGE